MRHAWIPRHDYISMLRIRVLRSLYTHRQQKLWNAISCDFTYFAAGDQSPSLPPVNTGADVSYEILIFKNSIVV